MNAQQLFLKWNSQNLICNQNMQGLPEDKLKEKSIDFSDLRKTEVIWSYKNRIITLNSSVGQALLSINLLIRIPLSIASIRLSEL